MRWPGYISCLLAPLVMGSALAAAGEFRSLQPILTPRDAHVRAGQAADFRPLKREKVTEAVKQVIAAWNDNRLDEVLDDRFYDRSRLVDAMQGKVPRDARLEALSIGEVQTLNREEVDTPDGRMRRSTVMVTVKTQLTFNDPQNGYQRRQGVNTYVLTITEPEDGDEGGD